MFFDTSKYTYVLIVSIQDLQQQKIFSESETEQIYSTWRNCFHMGKKSHLGRQTDKKRGKKTFSF